MSQYIIELNNEQEKVFSEILKETGENATSYLKKYYQKNWKIQMT